MNIRYEHNKDIDKIALQELFLSVEWDSGRYPEQLQKAIKTSHKVITAWEGDQLIGLINAIADDAAIVAATADITKVFIVFYPFKVLSVMSIIARL